MRKPILAAKGISAFVMSRPPEWWSVPHYSPLGEDKIRLLDDFVHPSIMSHLIKLVGIDHRDSARLAGLRCVPDPFEYPWNVQDIDRTSQEANAVDLRYPHKSLLLQVEFRHRRLQLGCGSSPSTGTTAKAFIVRACPKPKPMPGVQLTCLEWGQR